MDCSIISDSGMSHVRRYLAFCEYDLPLRCEICGKHVDSPKDLVVVNKDGNPRNIEWMNLQVRCRTCQRGQVTKNHYGVLNHKKVEELYNSGTSMMTIVHELNLPYNVVRQSLHDNPNVTVRSQGRVMSTEIDLIPLFERIYNNELSIIDACDQNSLCRSTIYRRYAQWKRSKNSK
jgi:hypothetical protein